MIKNESERIVLKVWGKEVGELYKGELPETYRFKYNSEWIESGIELSPLYMPNSAEVYEFDNLNPETYHHLPPMIADLLPDKFGSTLVDVAFALDGVSRDKISPLLRLSEVGSGGFGTITLHPAAAQPIGELDLNLSEIANSAKVTLGLLRPDELKPEALTNLLAVGRAAGGARAKIIISYNPRSNKYLPGHLPPPKGYESWLLKLDGVPAAADFPRIEFAYYNMAISCGIKMSESRLLTDGELTHFITKRFDRGAKNERIHIQSLCAMAQLDFNKVGTNTYEQYFEVIRDLGMGQAEIEQAFRRAVFNIVTCNRDDHSKNFSFLLNQSGYWQLAPAYDVTHAHNADGLWTKDNQMGINGKFTGVTLDDLYQVARNEGIDDYEELIADVLQAAYSWPLFTKQAGVTETSIESIAHDIATNLPG